MVIVGLAEVVGRGKHGRKVLVEISRHKKVFFQQKGLLVLDFLDQLQADHETVDEAEVPVFDPSKLQLVDFLTLFTLKTIADEN